MSDNTQPQVTARIPYEVYEKFERSLPLPAVTATATGEHAAWLAGVAFVLAKMRRDLVVIR